MFSLPIGDLELLIADAKLMDVLCAMGVEVLILVLSGVDILLKGERGW